jgi:copper chaperone CopZ
MATTVNKEFTVEGMSCGHCEMAVRKSLMEVEGVVSANADHQAKKVVVEASSGVEDAKLKEAITKAGYKVVG